MPLRHEIMTADTFRQMMRHYRVTVAGLAETMNVPMVRVRSARRSGVIIRAEVLDRLSVAERFHYRRTAIQEWEDAMRAATGIAPIHGFDFVVRERRFEETI